MTEKQLKKRVDDLEYTTQVLMMIMSFQRGLLFQLISNFFAAHAIFRETSNRDEFFEHAKEAAMISIEEFGGKVSDKLKADFDRYVNSFKKAYTEVNRLFNHLGEA